MRKNAYQSIEATAKVMSPARTLKSEDSTVVDGESVTLHKHKQEAVDVPTSRDTPTQRYQTPSKQDEEDLPKPAFIHRFVTNWLITDPNLYDRPPTKNYQVAHDDMKYLYMFGGRWRTLKIFPLNLISLMLVLVPGILYLIFTFSSNYALGGVFLYCWISALYNLVRAAVSDPGTAPRNIQAPLENIRSDISSKEASPDEYFNKIILPSYHSDEGVGVKYCSTCHIWRPPRTAHCSVCNSCCINLDHHCIFLNNCVGQRNYPNFLWFLLMSVTALALYLAGVITQHRVLEAHPVNIFMIVYGLLAILYPLLLLILHIYLTAQNLSTREYLNFVHGRHEKYVNVYQHSIWRNLMINWISRQKGLSLLKSKGELEDDGRMQRMDPLTNFVQEV